MQRILGIDPAWKSDNPSAVALVEGEDDTWRCVRIAPSAELFCGSETKIPSMLAGSIHGNMDLSAILEKAGAVSCIVVDIPLAKDGNIYRRSADSAISSRFSKNKCPAYTITENQQYNPGKVSCQIMSAAAAKGYCFNNKLIETYPHPAILSLLNLEERLEYKVNNRRKYWPHLTGEERKSEIIKNMTSLSEAITRKIVMPEEFAFNFSAANKIKELKNCEDMLDALVCAWIGIEYLNHHCEPFGDDKTTIWIPNPQQ